MPVNPASFQRVPGMNPQYDAGPDTTQRLLMSFASLMGGMAEKKKQSEKDKQQAYQTMVNKGLLTPDKQGNVNYGGVKLGPTQDYTNLINQRKYEQYGKPTEVDIMKAKGTFISNLMQSYAGMKDAPSFSQMSGIAEMALGLDEPENKRIALIKNERSGEFVPVDITDRDAGFVEKLKEKGVQIIDGKGNVIHAGKEAKVSPAAAAPAPSGPRTAQKTGQDIAGIGRLLADKATLGIPYLGERGVEGSINTIRGMFNKPEMEPWNFWRDKLGEWEAATAAAQAEKMRTREQEWLQQQQQQPAIMAPRVTGGGGF